MYKLVNCEMKRHWQCSHLAVCAALLYTVDKNGQCPLLTSETSMLYHIHFMMLPLYIL